MVKEVLVSGKLDTKDVMAFMVNHNYSRVGGALTGIAGVVSLIASPILFLQGDKTTAIALALVAFMYAIATPLGFYTKARRQMRMNPVFKNKMTFRFTEDTLKVQLYTGASEIPWPDVFRIKFLKAQVLVYLKENHALILPIANFACDDDLALVRDFVERNQLGIPKPRRVAEVKEAMDAAERPKEAIEEAAAPEAEGTETTEPVEVTQAVQKEAIEAPRQEEAEEDPHDENL